MKDSKLDQVLEGYKPIPMKRLFYPRGMNLSEQFINAFHREYDRLIGEGLNPKTLVERVGKAMKFHINDPRKYKLLDEEKAKLNEVALPSDAERSRKAREKMKKEEEAEKTDKDKKAEEKSTGENGRPMDPGLAMNPFIRSRKKR